MSLTFVTGRAGSGKTRWCLEEAARLLRIERLGAPVILLVPEQASFQTEQALLEVLGGAGFSRARVLSFNRLASWARALVPDARHPPLRDAHRRLLMAALVARRRLESEDELLRLQGIEEALLSLVAELRLFRVPSARLRAAGASLEAGSGRLSAKLGTIAGILEEYESVIASRFEDPAETLGLLRQALVSTDFLRGATVLVDGFAGFSPSEEFVLGAILSRALRVVIALLVDSPDATDGWIFEATRETMQRVRGKALEVGCEILPDMRLPVAGQPTRFLATGLKGLEVAAFAGPGPSALPATGLRLLVARDPLDEARAAVEQVAAWRRDHGWHWGEMAIVARDLASCDVELRRQLNAAGIPHFMDRLEPLEHHPLVVGLRAAIDLVLGRRDSTSLLEFARSGFIACDRDGIDTVEEHLRMHPRPLADWLSKEAWGVASHRFDPTEYRPTVSEVEMASIDQARRHVIAALAPLCPLLERPLPDELGAQDFVSRLAALLLEAWNRRGEEEREEAIFSLLGAALQEMLEACGSTSLEPAVLRGVLEGALRDLCWPRIPPSLDQVLVGQIDRSRHPPLRGLVVVGMVEGRFPAVTTPRSLLGDDDRARLEAAGIELAPGTSRVFAREPLYAYIAFTRASEALTLLRPRLSREGEELGPSPYWLEVTRAFPALREEELPPPLSWGRVQSAGELASLAAVELARLNTRRLPSKEDGDAGRLPETPLRHTRDFLAVWDRARDRNQASLSPALVHEFIGPALRTSVTALETFGRCPFQHFARHLLRPRMSARPEIQATDHGSLAHSVLHGLATVLMHRKIGFGGLEETELVRLLDAEVAREMAILRRSGLLSTRLQAATVDAIVSQLRSVVLGLRECGRAIGSRPVLSEVTFDSREGAGLPSLDFEVSGRRVSLRGRIDRIDVVGEGTERTWVMVIDYKLGGKKVDFEALYDGTALQLPAYLLVLRERPGGMKPGSALGGAFFLPLIVRPDPNEAEDRRLQGVAPVAFFDFLGDSIGGHFPRPAKSAADGGSTRGPALSEREFDGLLRHALAVAMRHAGGILAGEISIRPALSRSGRACAYCDLRAACRVDAAMNPSRVVPRLTRPEVLERLVTP